MKFDCGETCQERRERLETWHRFYAIWPRRIDSHDCRCFEWIERKGIFMIFDWEDCYWIWEYRSIDGDQK
jgi:hypothetical protein